MCGPRDVYAGGKLNSELLFGRDEETKGDVERRVTVAEACRIELEAVGTAVGCPVPLTCRIVAGGSDVFVRVFTELTERKTEKPGSCNISVLCF